MALHPILADQALPLSVSYRPKNIINLLSIPLVLAPKSSTPIQRNSTKPQKQNSLHGSLVRTHNLQKGKKQAKPLDPNFSLEFVNC